MRVTEVKFQNYKVLAEVCVHFARFTVLVGPNGCGKTTVLDAVADLLTAADAGAWSTASPAAYWRLFGTEERLPGIRTKPRVDGSSRAGATLTLTSTERPSAGVQVLEWTISEPVSGNYFGKVTLHAQGHNKAINFALPGLTKEDSLRRLFAAFSCELQESIGDSGPTFVRLALDPNQIRKPSPGAKSATQLISNDGAGLATVIGLLASKRHPALAAIEEALASVVPQVRRLLPEPTEIVSDEVEVLTVDGQPLKRVRTTRVPGWTLNVELDSGAVVPIGEMSEGTVLAMALLTVVYGPDAPEVVLLDDIDRALHPRAQAELVQCLRKILMERPQMQIVATTHSPYLLDLFEPEEVRVMALDARGHAVCRSLAEAPNLARLKQAYQTGEIWASIWEQWTLEEPHRGQ